MTKLVGPAAAPSVQNCPDPGTLGNTASPRRHGFFTRLCAAVMKSREQTAEAVISRHCHVLPSTLGTRFHRREGASPFDSLIERAPPFIIS